MGIDKTGQETVSASIIMPIVLVVTIPVFTTVFTNVGDDALGNFHGSVLEDMQLGHFFTSTGGKANRGNDTGIEYNQIFTHIVTSSYSMMRASRTCCMEKFSNPR